MSRRGITLIEVVAAITVFALLMSLLLRAFLLSDRMVMRSQADLQRTLGRVALQSQLRSDIWAAADFHVEAAGQAAIFTFPDGSRVVYASSGGDTVRTHAGEETRYQGTTAVSDAGDGLISVAGQDPEQWSFAARMRNPGARAP